MNFELQEQLYEDFPELFAQKDLSPMQSCMHFGLDCGDGWEPIIRKACYLLSRKTKAKVFVKPRDSWMHSIGVKLHNFCRKLERKLKLTNNSLYVVKHPQYREIPGWDIQFSQIKEKFGTLRIYYDVVARFDTEEVSALGKHEMQRELESLCGYVDGVLAFADQLSSETCEIHGLKGKLNADNRWWKVKCPACEK